MARLPVPDALGRGVTPEYTNSIKMPSLASNGANGGARGGAESFNPAASGAGVLLK